MRVPAHHITVAPTEGTVQYNEGHFTGSRAQIARTPSCFAVAENREPIPSGRVATASRPLARLRQTFDARPFATYCRPQEIIAVALRPRRTDGVQDNSPAGITLPETVCVHLSTTPKSGAPQPKGETLVAHTGAGGTLTFDKPYRYDPTDGDLLMELEVTLMADQDTLADTTPRLPLAVFICRDTA